MGNVPRKELRGASQHGGTQVLGRQQHAITNLEGEITSMLVCLLCLTLLCFDQVASRILQRFIPLLDGLHCRFVIHVATS